MNEETKVVEEVTEEQVHNHEEEHHHHEEEPMPALPVSVFPVFIMCRSLRFLEMKRRLERLFLLMMLKKSLKLLE